MAKILEKSGSIFKALLDILMPPLCYVCGRNCSGKYGLCDFCLDKIQHIPPPYCPKCGKRLMRTESTCTECSKMSPRTEKGWSCCYYKDTIKECVHLFKYKRYLGLMDIFRDIMLAFMEKNGIDREIDLIVPVPIHPTKKRERTYNHAEVLARSLANKLSIPINSKNLKKIKWTQSQSELDRENRLKNVRDTFLIVDKNVFSGKRVLLVDDVYTTGSTINECAKTLLGAKAKKVFFLTLARGA